MEVSIKKRIAPKRLASGRAEHPPSGLGIKREMKVSKDGGLVPGKKKKKKS